MQQASRAARLLLGLASLLLLTGSFYANRWGVVRPAWFDTFQRGSECHILGRLVKSRQDGIFSAGGLPGIGVVRFESPAEPSPYRVHFRRADLASGLHVRTQDDYPGGTQIDEQWQAYLSDQRFEIYSPYASQSGGQGMLFGALDAILPLPNRAKLALFRALTAALSAAVLTAIVLWFAREHSLGVGVCVLASVFFSQWLIGFGGRLWWSLWAFYLPFVALCRYESAAATTSRRGRTLFLLAFACVLVKCLINGFEYITTTLVMMLIPSVYYGIRRGTRASELTRTILVQGAGAVAAVATSLALLVAQLTALRGSAQFALRHILFALAVRTQANPEDFAPSYAAGLNASHWSVLASYLAGPYLDLRGRSATLDAIFPGALLALPYAAVVALFAAASVLLARLVRGQTDPDRRRPAFALVVATWASVLAPLSWLVIFKAHSYEHLHMNFVVWQMPFTLFGFAVCAALAAELVRVVRARH